MDIRALAEAIAKSRDGLELLRSRLDAIDRRVESAVIEGAQRGRNAPLLWEGDQA